MTVKQRFLIHIYLYISKIFTIWQNLDILKSVICFLAAIVFAKCQSDMSCRSHTTVAGKDHLLVVNFKPTKYMNVL